MTKQELEYRIEGLELEIASLEDENHWLEIEDMEVKRLEKALKTSEKELNDFKEKYLPQNLRDEQLFEIFIENKDKFTVEEFEKLLK